MAAGVSDVQSASAASELASFETSPGIVRTNLPVRALDVDGVSGLLYAVTDEPAQARLVAVDPGPSDSGPITPFDSVQIVDDVALEPSSGVPDVDVSRDGRSVVVGSADRAVVYDRVSLSPIATYSIPSRHVVASPSRPDRFLADQSTIVDGTSSYALTETIDPSNGGARAGIRPPYSWGADSESVIGVVDGRLGRVTISDPPVLVQVGPLLDVSTSSSLTFQGDRLLYGNILVDPITLTETDRLEPFEVGPRQDGTSSFAVVGDEGRQPDREEFGWRVHDVDDLAAAPIEWSFPLEARSSLFGLEGGIRDWASLPDQRLAVSEGGTGPTAYLTVADPGRMAGPYGEFHAVQPARVLDTRAGIGRDGIVGKLGAGSDIAVEIAGQGGVPERGVLAVVMNATVADPTQASYFSIWPAGVDRPEVSNLNFGPRQSIANSVTVAVGEAGAVRLANEFGSAHAVLDVVGYYSTEDGEPGARYAPVPSRRLLDTRPAAGGGGPVGPQRTVSVSLDDVAVPMESAVNQSAVAVALNVTAVGPTDGGFLTVWPSDSPRPVASSLNFARDVTRANLVVVGLGADNRSVDIYNESGSTDVLVDVFGVYVRPDAPRLDQQGKFLPIEPFRSFDSRVDSPYGPPGRIPENNSIIFGNYSGWTDIWNVTAVNPTADGFLSVLGFDPDRPNNEFPTTSNVNFRSGETVANGVYALGSPDTEVYNPFGETHVVIDRFGYLTPRFQRPANEVWER